MKFPIACTGRPSGQDLTPGEGSAAGLAASISADQPEQAGTSVSKHEPNQAWAQPDTDAAAADAVTSSPAAQSAAAAEAAFTDASKTPGSMAAGANVDAAAADADPAGGASADITATAPAAAAAAAPDAEAAVPAIDGDAADATAPAPAGAPAADIMSAATPAEGNARQGEAAPEEATSPEADAVMNDAVDEGKQDQADTWPDLTSRQAFAAAQYATGMIGRSRQSCMLRQYVAIIFACKLRYCHCQHALQQAAALLPACCFVRVHVLTAPVSSPQASPDCLP